MENDTKIYLILALDMCRGSAEARFGFNVWLCDLRELDFNPARVQCPQLLGCMILLHGLGLTSELLCYGRRENLQGDVDPKGA